MNNNINIGDKVYDTLTDRTGKVLNVYPELNIAIVKYPYETVKTTLDDLIVLKNDTEDEVKKDSLFDKVRAKLTGKKYD